MLRELKGLEIDSVGGDWTRVRLAAELAGVQADGVDRRVPVGYVYQKDDLSPGEVSYIDQLLAALEGKLDTDHPIT